MDDRKERKGCSDFDGTIAQGRPHAPLDFPPLRLGTVKFLKQLQALDYNLTLFSARTDRTALREYLQKQGISRFFSDITNVKPPDAEWFLDDRAIAFDGSYTKALRAIQNFQVHWEHGDRDDRFPKKPEVDHASDSS